MKILLKILAGIFLFFLFFVIVVYFFMVIKGNSVLASHLEGLTRKKVTVSYFGITPSLKLELRNVRMENAFRADRIIIAPSFLAFVTGNIGFNEIKVINPEFTYEKFPVPKTDVPAVAVNGIPIVIEEKKPEAAVVHPVENKPKLRIPFIFKRVNITRGKFNFIDHTVGVDGIKLTVKDISIQVNNLYLTRHPVITRFQLKGIIPWQAGEDVGRLRAEGWIDLYKKDMHAVIKIEDIDGVYLSPYFSQWINVQKSRIEKAKLDFSSNINGLDNNVAAECHIELRDIAFRERTPEEQKEKEEKVAKAVVKFFQSLDNGKIVFNFTIRTKMTRPEFGLNNLVGAVEDKLAAGIKIKKQPIVGNVFVLPVKLLEGAVKASSELSKAAIDATFAIGKELKKATQASFTREK